MLEQLEAIYGQALGELDGIADSAVLTEWERRYLGKKGEVTQLLRSTGKLPKEDRAAFGQRANVIKNEL
ncbi:MAG: phenylalanine--tRNA ligase subunit alpha, partial [Chloroflexi bacterium]|nr:phenylalanine--tRNA ligase subunit alpha [Chloroflexota bacterium]